MRKWIGIGIVLAATLVGGGLWAHAQVQLPNGRPDDGTVLTGNDLGFRVETSGPDSVTGRLVVRLNGKWVEAKSSGVGIKRLTLN
jgi:hypothetical protein